jgi:hypothetical protein
MSSVNLSDLAKWAEEAKGTKDYTRRRKIYLRELRADAKVQHSLATHRYYEGRKNPAKKVTLKNFTGTITKNANGTVSIKGRKK